MTIRRSVFASVVGSYGVFVLQLVTSMILSRLLTPAEMGVWGVAQAAIFLSSTLRDFGAGDYLVRSGDITRRSIGQVFAVMLSISLVCAALLWFGRGLMAQFFHEPRLVGLMGIATLTYLLMPFGLGALVIMERELAFVTIHVHATISTLIGSGTAIFLAWRGLSFYALAWGQFAQMVTVLALRSWVRPAAVFCRPVFFGWRGILHFGAFTTLNAFIGQFSAQFVTAIIGRLLGFSPLGLYDRAQSMSNYVSSGLTFPVMQVVYVSLVRVKDKPAELGLCFLATLENLAVVLWPAYTLMALLAPELFHVLFGPRWVAAVPLFRLICLGSLAAVVVGAYSRLLVALGRVQTISATEAPLLLMRIGLLLALAHLGLWYAALAVILPSILSVPIYAWSARPFLIMRWQDLARAALVPAGVSLFTVIPPALMHLGTHWGEASTLVQLLLSLPLGGLGWLCGIWLLEPRLKGELRKLYGYAISRPGRAAAAPAQRPVQPTDLAL